MLVSPKNQATESQLHTNMSIEYNMRQNADNDGKINETVGCEAVNCH